MSEYPQGEGWWQASDLRWYPPESAPGAPPQAWAPQPTQPPYGQPHYGQPPYGQPPYGQPPYGQPQYGYVPTAPHPPSPRKNNPAVLIVVVGLVVVSVLGVFAGVVVFAVGGTTSTAQVKACEIEARTIRTAEEAQKANGSTTGGDHPGYVTMDVLVMYQYLSEPLTNHRIVLDGPSGVAQSYSLVKAGKCIGVDYTP